MFLLFLLIPLCLCLASQMALIGLTPTVQKVSLLSQLDSHYERWEQGSFAPLNPALIGTIRADQLTQVAGGVAGGALPRIDTFPELPAEPTEVADNPTPTTSPSPAASAVSPSPTATVPTPTSSPTPTVAPSATALPTVTPAPSPMPVPPPTSTPVPSATPTDIPVPPVPAANLALAKTGLPAVVPPGGGLTYTLTVTNSGPDTARNVTLTDTLPAGVSFVSASPSSGSCSEAAGVVTCALGNVPSGGIVTVAIDVTASGCGTLDNAAVVASATGDPSGGNNSAVATNTAGNAPVAAADTRSVASNAATLIDVLGNDTDADPSPCDIDPSSVSITSGPSNGTVTSIDAATGAITYQANAAYTGSDSLTYRVCDFLGLCATAVLNLTVSAPVYGLFGPPDGLTLDIACGGSSGALALTTPIDASTPDAGYDLIFFEYPNAGGILLDFIIIEISADGLSWVQIFNWYDDIEDTNASISPYASYGVPTGPVNEIANQPFTGSPPLFDAPGGPAYPTGIGLDVDALVAPGSYGYIRFSVPAAGCTEAGQVDSIQVLP